MKLVTFKKKFMMNDNIIMLPGKGYVWPEEHIPFLQQPEFVNFIEKIEPLDILPFYHGESLDRKKLLVWRSGGYGDILFLLPLLRKIRRMWPKSEINFACFKQYNMIFRGSRLISNFAIIPPSEDTIREHDYLLHFEKTIESSTDPNVHAVDVFANHAGIELSDDEKRIDYRIDKKVRQAARDLIHVTYKVPPWGKCIAIQAASSSIIRNYPPHLMDRVIAELSKHGFFIFIFGTEGQGNPQWLKHERVMDTAGRFPMEISVAMLQEMHLLIAPDSSLVHFAGALNVPTVALYGPFPGAIRTKYYPRCLTLEATYPCAPCFLHQQEPCAFSMELNKGFWSPCFETIPPEKIVEAALEKFRRF